MNEAALIERFHDWVRVLSQDIYAASDGKARTDEILSVVRCFLLRSIASRMLASRGIPDAGHNKGIDIPEEASSLIQKELAGMDLRECPFEVLSDIYESCMARKLVLNRSTGKLEYSQEIGLKKGKGIYYTPGYIVRYIVDRTLGKYLWGTDDGQASENMPAKTPEDIRGLRILDPACGSGFFLIYAFDVLSRFYAQYSSDLENDWPMGIVRNHLYGIDLDSNAVSITADILMLKAMELTGRYARSTVERSVLNINQGNFLISQPTDWKIGMQEVMDSGGFTMILGNPPYGIRLTKTERRFIANYETYRSSDSSSLFVEKAVRMLKYGGVLGFIVPKSLSYVLSWQPIREFLLRECEIIEIADAGKAFKGVRLEQVVILARKCRRKNANTSISILRPEYSYVSHSIDKSALSDKRFSIWLSSDRIRYIVDKLWENSAPLGEVAEIWSGLNVQTMIPSLYSDDTKHHLLCLRGKDIQRYHIRLDSQYLRIAYPPSCSHSSLERFLRPKIVVQDIVAHIYNPKPHIKLVASIDSSESWLNMNTVTNVASSKYNLEYLCAILNSRLISWYAHNFIYNRAIRTMHFRRGYADHIPVRAISHDEAIYRQLIEDVIHIMSLYSQTDAPEDGISEVDRRLNYLVYELYGISEEDISFLREHADFC